VRDLNKGDGRERERVGIILLKNIAKKKALDEKDLKKLSEMFGERFFKGFDAVKEGKVKKYVFEPSGIEFWIVVGKKAEYIIFDYYCSCTDFLMNVVLRGSIDACYHLIARYLAEALGEYEVFRVPDRRIMDFMRDWKEEAIWSARYP